MNTKYMIFGGIVLTAGAIGMAGAGTAVWCIMNRKPPQYSNQQPGNHSLPQTLTSTRVAASDAQRIGSAQGEATPESTGANEIIRAQHSIIVNGQRITEEELLTIGREEKDDDDPSEPVITVPVRVTQAQASPTQNPSARTVVVNGQQTSQRDLAALDLQNRSPIPNGQYWYDQISGAWGYEGRPCEGFIAAGMILGGKLRADASNGDTGVFVNGRQLHRKDVAALQKLGPVFPGRYWVDGLGNWGIEGGPMIGNLKVAAAQVAQNSGASCGNANGGGTWSHRSSYTDSTVGGDGQTFYYVDKNSSYISSH